MLERRSEMCRGGPPLAVRSNFVSAPLRSFAAAVYTPLILCPFVARCCLVLQVVLFCSCVFYMTSHDDFLERNIGDFLPISQADRKVREVQIAIPYTVRCALSSALKVDF